MFECTNVYMFLNVPKKVSFVYKFHTEKCSLVVTMAAVDKELPSGGKREEREKRAKTLTNSHHYS